MGVPARLGRIFSALVVLRLIDTVVGLCAAVVTPRLPNQQGDMESEEDEEDSIWERIIVHSRAVVVAGNGVGGSNDHSSLTLPLPKPRKQAVTCDLGTTSSVPVTAGVSLMKFLLRTSALTAFHGDYRGNMDSEGTVSTDIFS